MIKPNELRIGNYLQDRDAEVAIVCEISEEDYKAYSGMVTKLPTKPIPLTEDWLVKFGFKMGASTQPDEYALQCEYFDLCYSPSNESWSIDNGDSVFIDADIKYVHQLQNLYFALTGKELELIK